MTETQRQPLPTRDEVKKINSLDTLYDMLSDVEIVIAQIETDLEYRNDDDATEDWEYKARGALHAHKRCRVEINRQIGRLRGAKQQPVQSDKHEAAAQRATAEAARNASILALSEEKTKRQHIQFAERQSWLAYFYRAASDMLPRETLDTLMEQARDYMRND